jgi:hypothetical protein
MASRGREAALLLYRNILQAHKKHLPTEMKELGDSYVKSEFRLHKTSKKPEQVEQFFTAWDEYLNQILKTARVQESFSTGALDDRSGPTGDRPSATRTFGKDLPPDLELSGEQMDQLETLKKEASQARKAKP